MSTTTSTRGAIRGAGRANLIRALADRRKVSTSGSLRADVWEQPYAPSPGRLDDSEARRLEADAQLGITYVVWSYATPIAWVRADGTVYHVEQRFSVTTSRQQGTIRTYLTE